MSTKRSFAFMFTLNNPVRDDIPGDWFNAGDVSFVVWQKEKGASGTIHLQGYFVVTQKTKSKAGYTMSWCIKNIYAKMSVQPRMGTHEQAVAYCTKTETRVSGPWTMGTHMEAQAAQRAAIGERRVKSTLTDVKADIDNGVSEEELWNKHFGSMLRYEKNFKSYKLTKELGKRITPKVLVYYGEPGCGKSMKAKQIGERNGGAYWWNSNNNVWFDGYDPTVQKVVVLDDFQGNLPYKFLLRMLDCYPMQVEIKGSMVAFNPTIIVITSNTHPRDWYFKVGTKDKNGSEYTGAGDNTDALIRRLQGANGVIVHMKKDPLYSPDTLEPDLETYRDLIETGDWQQHAAEVRKLYLGDVSFKESKQATSAIADDSHARRDEDLAEAVEDEWEQFEGHGGAPYTQGDDDFDDHPDEIDDDDDDDGIIDLEKQTSPIKNLKFAKINQAGRFKKLGEQQVQSQLQWQPSSATSSTSTREKPLNRKRKIYVNNDDDGSDF